MDNGRSILRFFFLANLICFVIFMHRSNSMVTQIKIKASCMCRKYKDTAEKTKKARITSSHITKTTTSTLEEPKLELEQKRETEAQSFLDRSWYSLNCSASFDLVIMPAPRGRPFSLRSDWGSSRELGGAGEEEKGKNPAPESKSEKAKIFAASRAGERNRTKRGGRKEREIKEERSIDHCPIRFGPGFFTWTLP